MRQKNPQLKTTLEIFNNQFAPSGRLIIFNLTYGDNLTEAVCFVKQRLKKRN